MRLPWKTEFPLKYFTVVNIFLTVQDFSATLRFPWKTEFALKVFTVLNILCTFRIFEQLALALKTESALNSLYAIYIFWSDVRRGPWLGRHCLFQSQIREYMNWMEKHKFTTQLADCRMTIAYALYPISWFVTHTGAEAILDLKESKI